MGSAKSSGTTASRTAPTADGPREGDVRGGGRRRAPILRRGTPVGAAGTVSTVLCGMLVLAACSPDAGSGDAKGSGAGRAEASAAPSATAAGGPGGRQGGKGGAPAFTVGPDGVTSWNPGGLGREHVTKPVHYPMIPPVGGDHAPVWMNCNGDVYTEAVPDVNAVHSLEHGAVWVTYTGRADPADVRKLAALVARTPYSLMSPYPAQKAPIMLTAWGRQRTVGGADDPAVGAFFADFVQGPQTPEPGAPCTGGLAR
ncbi:membrane protein [Streptomyces sulfonofaciens]|uniref:Membrane protein n=1 Tax=Streptomyces sulfonofaciens TaxID=68272 RepID=A0A919FZ39_9ACTN|nr:DUF3105 domain-containing protein [Streptomyces sulfonofaciens]GHH74628.1 membrane protein [Streptomyces sulfonofaciens]